MLIAGIDPGKKHLGFCIFDTVTNRIEKWELLHVDETSPRTLVASIRDVFEDVARCHRVYIERQPPQNTSMCRVQHYLQMYLELKCPMCEVFIVQASKRTRFLKAAAASCPTKLLFDTYHQRKKSSVAYVDHLLANGDVQCSDDLRSRFSSAEKRDDFAEALLLAFAA